MASAPDQRPQFIQFNLSTQWSLRKPYFLHRDGRNSSSCCKYLIL